MHQRDETAKRAFYDELRAKHGIRSLLGPYRVDVAATGPARGPASAPVTIVEFGDFQCPYCGKAESSLRAVLAQYPKEVRVVFRSLPLSQIHPQAELAAEAACVPIKVHSPSTGSRTRRSASGCTPDNFRPAWTAARPHRSTLTSRPRGISG